MQIATERLLLREFVESDWPAVLAYQSDPRYLRFYPWKRRTEEQVRTLLQQFIGWQQEQPRRRFQLAIVLPAEGKLIGNCGIRLQKARDRKGELGCELAPSWWGHGYATEAARAVLAFGFQEQGLHRVWARCVARNSASARLLERLGMHCEGRLREEEWFKGRWWDTLVYGILEEEWSIGR